MLDERDQRGPLQSECLHELAVRAGDTETRVILMEGREKFQREKIRAEALGVFAGWLARHNATISSTFFEEEHTLRAAIADEEKFERGVRKKFERQRVWVALAASLFADEEYDRNFLVGSQLRYRRELAELRVRSRGGVGDEVAVARTIAAETAARRDVLATEQWRFDTMVLAAHDERLSLLVEDIEYDELKLRHIVQEAFFATLAVNAAEEYPSLYRNFMQLWRSMNAQ